MRRREAGARLKIGFLIGLIALVAIALGFALGADRAPDPVARQAPVTVPNSGNELPLVTVVANGASAAKGPRDPAEFTISRTGPTTESLTVDYQVSGGAESSDNYNSDPDRVIIPTGATSITLAIDPVDDGASEAEETVALTLLPRPAYMLGTPSEFSSGTGIPFGAFGMEEAQWGDVYTGAQTTVHPDSVIALLRAARKAGMRISISLAGASKRHYQYPAKTFDLAAWKARVDRFAGADLEQFVADGVLIAHYLVDEPKSKSEWGGEVIPNDVLDEMARYSTQRWPTLPTVVREQPTKLADHAAGRNQPLPEWRWQFLDTAWAQYAARKGPIYDYADTQAAEARRQGLGLIVGLNALTGGDGSSGIRGPDVYADKWVMSPEELRAYGAALIAEPYACAFTMWTLRFDNTTDYEYFARPEIGAAITDLSQQAEIRSRTPCNPFDAVTATATMSDDEADEM